MPSCQKLGMILVFQNLSQNVHLNFFSYDIIYRKIQMTLDINKVEIFLEQRKVAFYIILTLK